MLFEALIRDGRTPECLRFRADNHQHLALIEKMEREQVLKIKDGRYEIPGDGDVLSLSVFLAWSTRMIIRGILVNLLIQAGRSYFF